MPARLRRIIQGWKEQEEVKRGWRDYNDRGLDQILIGSSGTEGGSVEKSKIQKNLSEVFQNDILSVRSVPGGSEWSKSLHQGRR